MQKRAERENEKEHDELAKPSCPPPSTELCSQQPAPLPSSRPVPAGGHRRGAPETRRRPAGGRGAGPGSTGGSREELRSQRRVPGVLRVKGGGEGGTETRGRGRSERRAPSDPPPGCRGRPAPLRTAAVAQLPEGSLVPLGVFTASPPGARSGAKPPPFHRRRPRAAYRCRRPGPPVPSPRWQRAPLLPSKHRFWTVRLSPRRNSCSSELCHQTGSRGSGLSRRAWLRFPAPAQGGRRPPPQVRRREAGGCGPGEHLAPSQF